MVNYYPTSLADRFQQLVTRQTSPCAICRDPSTKHCVISRFSAIEQHNTNRRAVKPRPTGATGVTLGTGDAITAAALSGDETDPTITFLPRARSAVTETRAYCLLSKIYSTRKLTATILFYPKHALHVQSHIYLDNFRDIELANTLFFSQM